MQKNLKEKKLNEVGEYLETLKEKVLELEQMRSVKQYLLYQDEMKKSQIAQQQIDLLYYNEETDRFYQAICYSRSSDGVFQENLSLRCKVLFETFLVRALLKAKEISYEQLKEYYNNAQNALQANIAYQDDPFIEIPSFPSPVYLDPIYHEIEWDNDFSFNGYKIRLLNEKGILLKEDGTFVLSENANIPFLEETYGLGNATLREKCAFQEAEKELESQQEKRKQYQKLYPTKKRS